MRGATTSISFRTQTNRISTHAPLAGRDDSRRDGSHYVSISTHAPLAGRDCFGAVVLRMLINFNPRAPCGARQSCKIIVFALLNFNPRAPCGARRLRGSLEIIILLFQPTRPLRGATASRPNRRRRPRNFNPRAPCGARRCEARVAVNAAVISTHAPLAGRDEKRSATGGRHSGFQPTRPLRGATSPCAALLLRLEFQPTRPLRGATEAVLYDLYSEVFQPTRPLRGATDAFERARKCFLISTHAPLAGRDLADSVPWRGWYHFNPRAPCGARRVSWPRWACKTLFQPTRPLRGATFGETMDAAEKMISTHAPLAGRDGVAKNQKYITQKFQPTRPLRGATAQAAEAGGHPPDFNPRAPCGARLHHHKE